MSETFKDKLRKIFCVVPSDNCKDCPIKDDCDVPGLLQLHTAEVLRLVGNDKEFPLRLHPALGHSYAFDDGYNQAKKEIRARLI